MLPVTNKTGRELRPDEAAARADGRIRDGAANGGAPSDDARGRLSSIADAMRKAVAGSAESSTKPTAPAKPAAGTAGLRERAPGPRVAEQLVEQCSEEVVLLHHRLTPRVKPHIDHLVVGHSGVWVVHSRKNGGRVATRKPMFGDAKLSVGGRERTDLLMNLERQVSYVEGVLAKDAPDVPVRSAICFVDTEPPLVRTLYLGSYLFFGAPALAKHLNSEGPLDLERIQAVAALLEEAFPPA